MSTLHGRCGWLITYSDMITLLIAFFIATVSFASKHADRHVSQGDSGAFDGASGSGVAGPGEKNARPAAIWRIRFPQRLAENERGLAPLYTNPAPDTIASIVRGLTGSPVDNLGDRHVLRLPLDLLFGASGRLSPSGGHVLRALATNLGGKQYDFLFRVQAAEQVPLAVQLCTFLSGQGLHPSRLAVGVRPEPATDEDDSIWLVLTRQM